MTAKYYAILTTLGAAKLANAMALGTKLEITTMAVGDGGGVLPTPDANQTAIVGEQRRAPINMLSIDPANPGQIIAEQVIPENEGGFWIRTIGLYDKDGTLIAVANCPETYKPQLQEGSGRTQTIRMILIVSNTDAITLKIDPAVVLATRKYVDDKVIEVKAYADELMAAHLASANPHNQYAPKASPALTGTPTAPTPVKTDNTTKLATTAHVKQVVADYAPLANPALTGKPTAPTAAQTSNDTQLATTAFVKAAITALIDSSPAAMDTLNELAAALNDDPNFAATMTAELSKKMDKASNGADIPDIAAFLNNLQLGGAAKRDVGTGNNQLPDMSAFGMSRNGQTAWDILPNGMIRQAGTVALTPVGNFNMQVLGGVTYYTHYYRVNFPRQFPNAQIATLATLASYSYSTQSTMAGKSLATHRDTDSGTDVSRARFTVAYTTPNLGEIPTLHFESIGY
ncbi:phage tail protein [Salmonella enterica subsp. enterica serovar Minnesota]|nr:phage tail protein [Salmonella enterica subsp. enterica serovar Minnesota]